jgi:hypothetical protein
MFLDPPDAPEERGRDGRRHAWPCLLLAALFVLALALAPRADAYIYWDSAGKISRANLQGTGANKGFIADASGPYGGPCGVAVDAKHVYWATTRPLGEGFWQTIARANLDGTGVDKEFIVVPSLTPACTLTVDAEHIYWGNSRGGIARANVDGSGIDTGFIPTGVTTGALAVDRAHIYWLDQHSGGCTAIARANLNGTGVDDAFIYPICAGVDFAGLAVDGAHVYWTSTWYDPSSDAPSAYAIGRASLDGTGVDEHFISTDRSPVDVAVDGAHVYWRSARGGGQLGRAHRGAREPRRHEPE